MVAQGRKVQSFEMWACGVMWVGWEMGIKAAWWYRGRLGLWIGGRVGRV